MSRSSSSLPRRTLAALRPALGVGAVLLGYLALRASFASLAARGGLVSPAGLPGLGVLALGLGMIALRLVLLFAAPGFVTYLLVERLLERLGRRSLDPGRPVPPVSRPGPPD